MYVLEAVGIGIGLLANPVSDKDPLIQDIHSKVMEVIVNSDNVPGLKAEEFKVLKPGIEVHWNKLVNDGVLEITAADADVRPCFVAIQGIVEHVISNTLGKNIKSLTGVIHTPTPATPLCTEGSISSKLVDQAIENDPLRLFTVKARTTILRDYLSNEGRLYVVYPQEGIAKRTADQQEIYKKVLGTYPVHLIDSPMNCESIDTSLTGAFYIFANSEGKQFVFGIKMSQANNLQDSVSFGLWLDEYSFGKPAFERVNNVMEFVRPYVGHEINF